MNSYFQPLHSKIGVVTLVIACAYMALWMRSLNFADIGTIILPVLGRTYSVYSHNGMIEWYVREGDPTYPLWWWFSSPIINYPNLVSSEQPHLEIHHCGEVVSIVTMPHSRIVMLLTLISAWPLLSKPKAITTPPNETGD